MLERRARGPEFVSPNISRPPLVLRNLSNLDGMVKTFVGGIGNVNSKL